MKQKLANLVARLEYRLSRLCVLLGRCRRLYLQRPVCAWHGPWQEDDAVEGLCQRCCHDHFYGGIDPSEERLGDVLNALENHELFKMAGIEFQADRIRYAMSHIQNGPGDFTPDLFSIEKLWLNKGKVVFAERMYSVTAPLWLERAVFGHEASYSLHHLDGTDGDTQPVF